MKILVIGAGPSGLLFAAAYAERARAAKVTVIDRRGPDDIPGWGITTNSLACEALGLPPTEWTSISPACFEAGSFRRTYAVFRFAGVSRGRILEHLRARCEAANVELRFNVSGNEAEHAFDEYDLVVGADGVNSWLRTKHEAAFQTRHERSHTQFLWMGIENPRSGMRMMVRESEGRRILMWSYNHTEQLGTAVIQCATSTIDALGLHGSNEETCRRLEAIFGADLHGGKLVLRGDYPPWTHFDQLTAARSHAGKVVLIGDALKTAHFSLGMGTALAIDDALELVRVLYEHPTSVDDALAAFEAARRPEIIGAQRETLASMRFIDAMLTDPDAPTQTTLAARFVTKLTELNPEFYGRIPVAITREWQAAVAPMPHASSGRGEADANELRKLLEIPPVRGLLGLARERKILERVERRSSPLSLVAEEVFPSSPATGERVLHALVSFGLLVDAGGILALSRLGLLARDIPIEASVRPPPDGPMPRFDPRTDEGLPAAMRATIARLRPDAPVVDLHLPGQRTLGFVGARTWAVDKSLSRDVASTLGARSVALLAGVLRHLDDAAALAVLRALSAAMGDDALLVVADDVLPTHVIAGLKPTFGLYLSDAALVLAQSKGRVRTASELMEMFEAAGLVGRENVSFGPGEPSALVATTLASARSLVTSVE